MLEMEDMLAHMAKIVIFSYGILSGYPKNIIATALLLAALTASSLLNQFLHDKVHYFANSGCLVCPRSITPRVLRRHSEVPEVVPQSEPKPTEHEEVQ